MGELVRRPPPAAPLNPGNSQVHELHPSHPFLVFPDKFVRSHSEPQFYSSTPQDFNEQCEFQVPKSVG